MFCRDLDYQASSPDEKALVEACAKVGFIFTGDDNDIVTVRVKKTVFRRTNKVRKCLRERMRKELKLRFLFLSTRT